MRSSSKGWTEVPSATAGSVFDFDKPELIRALQSQRVRTLELLRGASEAEWEREIVPRWRLREVAAHLVTTDEGNLTGRVFTAGLTRRADAKMISKVEAWNDRQVGRWADRPIPEILAGAEKWSRRMERLARAVPAAVGRPAIPTPFGQVSMLWLVSLRVYDEWIHGEDIRRALGRPSDDAPASVLPIARQILAGIPVQTTPRIGAGSLGRVAVAFDDVPLPPMGVDLGGRAFGFGVDGTDARVTGRAAPLAMVAARRDAWRDLEASGGLKVEGDRRAAEVFLDALLLV
jgi:uncharacterized protein (TIGR03083 family)